jgi:uncharacterized protein YbjT (DUF2867 family)
MAEAPHIAVLGARGLIGHGLAAGLLRRGFAVRAYARAFTPAQKYVLQWRAQEVALVGLSEDGLADLLVGADVVVNCLGVLQGRESETVHRAVVARLAAAAGPARLLVHFSVPGDDAGDATAFSRSKRDGERAIAAAGNPFLILRPGFVIAEAAYGGSALIRALAALPLRLPRRESGAPFAATALSDICETLARLVPRWRAGEKAWRATWDVMEQSPGRLDDVIDHFRAHYGASAKGPHLPGWLMRLGALAGDVAGGLGWRPPIRSTALTELRRGVSGDPAPWMAATGIIRCSARDAVAGTPASVQEKWFARLYLLKAVALVTLVIFWCASGAIALTAGFTGARAILLAHGFPFPLAQALTILSSGMDIAIGALVAVRATSRFGLVAGIVQSLVYMTLAALLTPELWLEPLGALVKTGPAIVLMLFCLAVSDDR